MNGPTIANPSYRVQSQEIPEDYPRSGMARCRASGPLDPAPTADLPALGIPNQIFMRKGLSSAASSPLNRPPRVSPGFVAYALQHLAGARGDGRDRVRIASCQLRQPLPQGRSIEVIDRERPCRVSTPLPAFGRGGLLPGAHYR